MNTTTINDAETARKVADKIVTLMTSITEQESAQEREMNAVAAESRAQRTASRIPEIPQKDRQPESALR